MSPYCTRRLPGIPCTTSSFTDTQMCPGYPLYPRNGLFPPQFLINSPAASSSSPVVRPGCTRAATALRIRAAAAQAFRIPSISLVDLIGITSEPTLSWRETLQASSSAAQPTPFRHVTKDALPSVNEPLGQSSDQPPDPPASAATAQSALAQKSIVMPHDQVRLDLPHRIEHHTDGDQQARSAEKTRRQVRQPKVMRQECTESPR